MWSGQSGYWENYVDEGKLVGDNILNYYVRRKGIKIQISLIDLETLIATTTS